MLVVGDPSGIIQGAHTQPLPTPQTLPLAFSQFCLLSIPNPSCSCSPRFPGCQLLDESRGIWPCPTPAWVAHPGSGCRGSAPPVEGGVCSCQASLIPYKLPWKPPSNHANRPSPRVCSSIVWLSLGPSRVTSGAQGQAEDREPWGHLVHPPLTLFEVTTSLSIMAPL